MSFVPRLWSAATAAATTYLSRSTSSGAVGYVHRVAVIGAGAAGLAAARAASREGHECIVLEKDEKGVGGIWKYTEDDSATRPMYRGLRTNLPKEVMAFPEFPWGDNEVEASFVSHSEVLRYLQRYCHEFGLEKMIRFGCAVTQVRLLENDQKMEVTWTTSDNKMHRDVFDSVMVCNGHYAIPFIPKLSGIEHFQGRILHSIAYDDPRDFTDERVLCIGARASGSDLTREISSYAKQVYVSDSAFSRSNASKDSLQNSNIVWLPRTVRVDADATIHFADSTVSIRDVDTIIFCSGYYYDFPFLKNEENSGIPVLAPSGERRVGMLYKGLWHATRPRLLSFLGLQHSVVPFPLFECQARAVVSSWSSPSVLPSLEDRLKDAQKTYDLGEKAMYLGDAQWDYCREVAKMAGFYDDSVERYLRVNEGLYNHSGAQRKRDPPGAPDLYREVRYTRNDAEGTFGVIFPDDAPHLTSPSPSTTREAVMAAK